MFPFLDIFKGFMPQQQAQQQQAPRERACPPPPPPVPCPPPPAPPPAWPVALASAAGGLVVGVLGALVVRR